MKAGGLHRALTTAQEELDPAGMGEQGMGE